MSGLISLKREFDFLKLETDNISQFLAYYALLLTTACEYGIISKLEAESISKEILESFNEKFDYNPTVMANNMYAVTIFLQSMRSNTTQVESLMKFSASELFNEANRQLFYRINKMRNKLSKIYSQVINLKEDAVKKSFTELLSKVEELQTYSKEDTKISFKKLHNSSIVLYYSFLFGEKFKNKKDYVSTLEQTVSAFVTEVEILSKLEGSDIIHNLREWKNDNLDSVIKNAENVKQIIEEEIHQLQVRFDEEKQNIYRKRDKADKAFALLEKEDRINFAKEHPDLKGEEFEDAFEIWQMSLPDSHFEIDGVDFDEEDEIRQIESVYNEKMDALQEKLKEVEERFEDDFVMRDVQETIDFSLSTVLRLIAIFEAVKMEQIQAPTGFEELNSYLDNMDIGTAINVVQATIKPNLSEAELSYLRE